MDHIFETQSPLPWLDSGSSKIHLEVSLRNNSSKVHEGGAPSFRLLDSSSPLFNLVHASYRTSSNKLVKEVFLLVQKDHCLFTEKNTHYNNPEIDKLWQDAFKFDGVADGLECFGDLSGSSAEETSFPLWRALFYCEKRTCYFHPPCPQCGNLLELCHDDGVLSAAGLPLYTTTLERFLFCPVCHAGQSGTDFFTHDGSDDAFPRVKNCQALVAEFGQLVENGLAGADFPCQTCAEQNDCYGSELASSRLRPFAFYPFRMLITDAGQMPARDFLSILSGASWAEMRKQSCMMREPGSAASLESLQEQGTEGAHLFFENDTRDFLEILYLKIALLEQISRTAFFGMRHLKHPDLRLSMDQFWVDFPDFQGLLPLFWNFKVKPLALGVFPSEETSFVRVPEALSLYSLALLWFNTLLVNKKQSAGDVQRALAAKLDKETSLAGDPEFSFSSMTDSGVFGPENIFWLPDAKQLSDPWHDLWQKTLGLGWTLLQASFQSADFSGSLFLDEIKQLADGAKTLLFAVKDESVTFPKEELTTATKTDDSGLLRILLSLQEKWKDDVVLVSEEVVPEPEPEPMPQPAVEETISVPEKAESPLQEEELEKTVILSADQLATMMEKGEQTIQKDAADEICEETAKSDSGAEEELEKTVIMNLNDLESILPKENATAAAVEKQQSVAPPPEVVDDGLSETVIINLEELEKLRKGKNGNK